MVDEAYRILKGHRSIVNHARYSAHNRMLFSSGVEKIIKVSYKFANVCSLRAESVSRNAYLITKRATLTIWKS